MSRKDTFRTLNLPTDNVEIALIGQRTAALDAERPQCTSAERCDGGSTPAGDGSCRRGEHRGMVGKYCNMIEVGATT